jgi:hypothetical protein
MPVALEQSALTRRIHTSRWWIGAGAWRAAIATLPLVMLVATMIRGGELAPLPTALPAYEAVPGRVPNGRSSPPMTVGPAPLFDGTAMGSAPEEAGAMYDWVFEDDASGVPAASGRRTLRGLFGDASADGEYLDDGSLGDNCDGRPLVYEYAPFGILHRDAWRWQMLPNGLIYRSYLAGPKEPRLATVWLKDQRDNWYWDSTLGGRVGLLRYGDTDDVRPNGFQMDVEGAAFPRLDLQNNRELVSSDFRAGVPFTFGIGPWELKLAYYHLSSHLGDEYMVRNPGAVRVNYTRDALVLGFAVHWWDVVRLYGEVDWAVVYADFSRPFHFQFGAEYSPLRIDSFRGSPFGAVNVVLRQENDFAGTLTAQAGWQWNGVRGAQRFRIGGQYQVGKNMQYEFYNANEQHLGVGMWYDF